MKGSFKSRFWFAVGSRKAVHWLQIRVVKDIIIWQIRRAQPLGHWHFQITEDGANVKIELAVSTASIVDCIQILPPENSISRLMGLGPISLIFVFIQDRGFMLAVIAFFSKRTAAFHVPLPAGKIVGNRNTVSLAADYFRIDEQHVVIVF